MDNKDEIIKNKDETILEMETDLRALCLKLEDLQTQISKKCEEIHQVNDRCNEMQLKMYTVNEEFENFKSTSSREVSYLQKSLKEINEQNKSLIKNKFESQEEFKATRLTLESQVSNLNQEIKEVRLYSEGLESGQIND